jgi:hypothetical protein
MLSPGQAGFYACCVSTGGVVRGKRISNPNGFHTAVVLALSLVFSLVRVVFSAWFSTSSARLVFSLREEEQAASVRGV